MNMHNSIVYEPLLVALSYLISVLGSYTALQLAIAIPQARGRMAALGWVTGAAVALGGGAIKDPAVVQGTETRRHGMARTRI